MSKLGPGDQPFSTQNPLLAFCLYIAGIPFVDPARPVQNIYTAKILKQYGYTGPTNLLEAARECIKAGKVGSRRYHFKRTPELLRYAKIYNEQEVDWEKPDGRIEAAQVQLEIMTKVATGDMKPAEALFRATHVSLKARALFLDMWRELPGTLIIDNPGETTRELISAKEELEISPGWTVVGTNATPETLKRLGL